MAEIFRDTPTNLTLDVAGATNIFCTIIKDSAEVMTANGSPVTLPFKIIGYDGKFEVRWEFNVPGDVVVHTRYEAHEIVTPYLTVPTQDQPRERLVRRVINSYVGQNFGYSYGAIAVQGNGTDTIRLPKRLIDLDGVNYNIAPFTIIPIGYVNVINDGWGLTTAINNSNYYDIKEAPPEPVGEIAEMYVSNGAIYVPGAKRNWARGMTYLILGSWGWEDVPLDVIESAQILFDDYSYPESEWRRRYLANLRAGDWRTEYNGQAFIGTGNTEADKLLDKYRLSGAGII